MNKISYFKRVIDGEVKELHYHQDCGDYTKGKSYPESQDSFFEEEMEEMELNDWLDEGLRIGIFSSDVLTPNLSSS